MEAEFNFRPGYYGQPMGILAGEVLVVLSYYGQPVGILEVEVVVVVARHCSTSILPVFQQTEGILVEEVVVMVDYSQPGPPCNYAMGLETLMGR